MRKVTFTRLTRISEIPGDDKVADIRVDGASVGELQACMVEAGPCRREVAIGSYDIMLADGYSASWGTSHSNRSNPEPRAALAAAKRFVRAYYGKQAITCEARAAVDGFIKWAAQNGGPDWKIQLGYAWLRAGSQFPDYFGPLHALRNTHGSKWLEKFEPPPLVMSQGE